MDWMTRLLLVVSDTRAGLLRVGDIRLLVELLALE
jgi:hypothetical protein